jgi:hypothetical protein
MTALLCVTTALLILSASLAAEERADASNSSRLLLLDATQPQYLPRFFEQMVAGMHSTEPVEIVLLHQADAASLAAARSLKAAASPLPAHVALRLFSDNSVPLRSPTVVPLVLAHRFLLQRGVARQPRTVVFMDGMRVAWCGDVFDLSDFSKLLVVESCWGAPSCETPVPGPYLIGGPVQRVTQLLAYFADTAACSSYASDAMQMLPFAVERYSLAFGPPVTSPRIVAADFRSSLCKAAREIVDSGALLHVSRSVCDAAVRLAAPVSAVVDFAMCAEGHEAGDFCGTNYLGDVLRISDEGHDQRAEALKAALPFAHRSLTEVRSWAALVGTHNRTKRTDASKYGQCGQGSNLPNAVVGVAGGKAGVDYMREFVETFLASANTACTVLSLFVDDPEKVRVKHAEWSAVRFLSMADYPIEELPSSCGWADKRFELYYRWLQRHADEYFMAAFVDVRDIVFQADPFGALFSSQAWKRDFSHISASDNLVLAVMEDYSAQSSSAYAVAARNFFSFWHDHGISHAYRALLDRVLLPPKHDSLPVLCSGLIVGSTNGLLHLTLAHLGWAKYSDRCGFDQGIFQMLVVDGLRISGFNGTVALLNGNLGPFRNGAWRPQDTLWSSRTQQMVNCRGEPYAIVHQHEGGRHPWGAERIVGAIRSRAKHARREE